MSAKPAHVDYGNTESEFQFRFDTTGMKAGDHRKIHFTGEEFIDHVGITTADLFNPTGAEITTNAVKGHYGVSAFHGKEGGDPTGGDWVRTANRVPVRGIDKNSKLSVDSEFQHSNLPNVRHTTSLKLRLTKDQLGDRAKANNRKGIATWANMKPENVTAGVQVAEHSGQKRYIIPESDETGMKNATFAYLQRNATKPGFMNGVYKSGPTSSHMGKKAFVVKDESHFDAMHSLLKNLTETHSPYQRGLGVTVTKLDNEAHDEPLVVSMKFKRDPLSLEEGFQAKTSDNAVTESHMRTLVNGGKAPDDEIVNELGETLSAAGFDSELASSKDPKKFLESFSIKPFKDE